MSDMKLCQPIESKTDCLKCQFAKAASDYILYSIQGDGKFRANQIAATTRTSLGSVRLSLHSYDPAGGAGGLSGVDWHACRYTEYTDIPTGYTGYTATRLFVCNAAERGGGEI